MIIDVLVGKTWKRVREIDRSSSYPFLVDNVWLAYDLFSTVRLNNSDILKEDLWTILKLKKPLYL